MPDKPPRLRQWKLMSLLSARRYGLTIRELVREMDVGEKTIRRNLDLFRRVGMPLEATSGERGRKTWRIAGERGQPPLTFHCRGRGNCARLRSPQAIPALALTETASAPGRKWVGRTRHSGSSSQAGTICRLGSGCAPGGRAVYSRLARWLPSERWTLISDN